MRRWATSIGAVLATLAAAPPAAASGPTIPPAELHAIRVLLRSFVPEAVGRHHPGRAWALVTPAMRSTTTRAEWRHGSLPVNPYPVARKSYGIRPISVGPIDVIFDLTLQPAAGSDTGVGVYTTEVQRIGGRWLVASMTSTAQFAGPGGPATITAEPDLAPHAAGITQNASGAWMFVAIALFSLPLIGAPLGILIIWRRGRTTRADLEARERAIAPWR
jgi:hypothetical protein